MRVAKLRWNKWQVLGIFCVITALASTFLGAFPSWDDHSLGSYPVGVGVPPVAPRVAAAIGPIFIDGSSATQGWDDCPWVNGSGLPDDPYRIENLTIDAGGTGSCIEITKSQAYFIVRNCSFLGTSIDIGVSLTSVHNGTVEKNNATARLFYGIAAIACSNLTVANNNLSSLGTGIEFYSCNNATFYRNICQNDSVGIYCSGYNFTILENDCSYFRTDDPLYGGITLIGVRNATVGANNCSGGQSNGIRMRNVLYSNILENNCSNNVRFGIEIYYLETSKNVNITRNWFIRNTAGAIDDLGGYGTAWDNFIVEYPSAHISANFTAVMLGEAIGFSDASTGGEGSLQREWDFGDGMPNSTATVVAHEYTAAGTYNVTLRVNDSAGFVSVTCQAVVVRGPGWHIYYAPTGSAKFTESSGEFVAHLSLRVDEPVQVGIWISEANPVQALPKDKEGYGRAFITVAVNDSYCFSKFDLTVGYTGQSMRGEWDPQSATLWWYNFSSTQWEVVNRFVTYDRQDGVSEWNVTGRYEYFPFYYITIEEYPFETTEFVQYFCLTFDPPFPYWIVVMIAAAVGIPTAVVLVKRARRKKALAKAAQAKQTAQDAKDAEWEAMNKQLPGNSNGQ